MDELKKKRKHLVWKLPIVMANKRIKSIAELKRRLETVGIDITSTQLGRMHFDRPSRLNLELLEGLATVLDCEISDIMDFSDDVVFETPEKTDKGSVGESKPAKKSVPVREKQQTEKNVIETKNAESSAPVIAAPQSSTTEDKFAGIRSLIGPKVTPIPMNRKK